MALAAAEVARRDPAALQAVLPADHVISPEGEYLASVEAGANLAAQGRLVTFGIEPTFPATGYGYIERGSPLGTFGDYEAFEVDAFHEKPDLDRATEYLATGRFLWNSGMFLWSTQAISAALERHAAKTWELLRDARGPDLAQAYDRVESLPVDVGVLEQASERAVIPVAYSWSDVGTWRALSEVAPHVKGNVLTGGGSLWAIDARDNVVWAEKGSLTALIGVKDLVVVRSGNAVLVCPRSRSEEVKELVTELPEEWL